MKVSIPVVNCVLDKNSSNKSCLFIQSNPEIVLIFSAPSINKNSYPPACNQVKKDILLSLPGQK